MELLEQETFEYRECSKGLSKLGDAQLKDIIDIYKSAGRVQRFFWDVDPEDMHHLEMKVAEAILQQRNDSRLRWWNYGPGPKGAA